jgi:hypothetical protein
VASENESMASTITAADYLKQAKEKAAALFMRRI